MTRSTHSSWLDTSCKDTFLIYYPAEDKRDYARPMGRGKTNALLHFSHNIVMPQRSRGMTTTNVVSRSEAGIEEQATA